MDELSIDSQSNKVYKLNINQVDKRPHFTINWRQLTYYHRERRPLFNSAKRTPEDTQKVGKKLILNSLDGCFKSGQLSAILGPSGAGKSTFLSALFGDKQESAFGQTKVTWFTDSKHTVPIESNVKQRPIRIAFLPQHDHLLDHLSVYEALMFASKIKNATRLNEMKKLNSSERLAFHKQNVRRVAKMLKLLECLETRCGRLSGGQYKRVSIGQELLSEPDVIILDEPTSGLDAMTCLTTVRTLKSIAMKHPISIVLTIHQPDIDVFNLFDHIYVIAQGGRAIYEGPPEGVAQTLASANLHMPTSSYNPARFIVEHAFIAPPDTADLSHTSGLSTFGSGQGNGQDGEEEDDDELYQETSENLDAAEDEHHRQKGDFEAQGAKLQDYKSNLFKRSLISLTDALNYKQTSSKQAIGPKNLRESGRKPLLNFGGVKTSDGKFIPSEELGFLDKNKRAEELFEKHQLQRLDLLKRLNQVQKSKYYPQSSGSTHNATSSELSSATSSSSSDTSSEICSSDSISDNRPNSANGSHKTIETNTTEAKQDCIVILEGNNEEPSRKVGQADASGGISNKTSGLGSSNSFRLNTTSFNSNSLRTTSCMSTTFSELSGTLGTLGRKKLRRQFDKRLSARHNNSKQNDYPIFYHSYLLTHRTWLSIVRDPIFFGIQFCMHTTIPILLALIFGSQQEEGCPRLGQFDLVDFAYREDSNEFIKATMQSIRQSIGNIGVIFFEMFVLSFAINCITALVFPLDMYVLLKEYRNGWYSLRSYFIGRTLADLPVPIALHSMAMTILYYMTGQPHEWWRFGAIIVIVIIASLVAQSVGLTIGALLMRSSQSAVLAAAGIVAPFFALSGFIVRIHTLPWIAQWAANGSYLYHLLNGFIIMRYGFGRCPCDSSDFQENDQHKIPHNLRTMASIWIGTYSNEYETLPSERGTQLVAHQNRTNIDPNIDLVDKLTGAFKMANSYGHKVESCDDVLPYAMLDFNLHDSDIWYSCMALVLMLLVTRLATFSAIYYKIRSFA